MTHISETATHQHKFGLRASHVSTLAFLLVVSVFFFYVYSGKPAWNGWWDQSQYIISAVAFSEWNLNADQHWYPIAYPLAASVFVGISPGDPFMPVNLICLLLFAWAFVRFFTPILGAPAAMVGFIGALLIPFSISYPISAKFPLWLQFVIPWTTIPVSAIYMLVIYCYSILDKSDRIRPDFVLGFLSALLLFIRPADIAPLVLPGMLYLFYRFRSPFLLKHLFASLAGMLVVIVPGLILMIEIYGGISSPYSRVSENIGLGFSNIFERAYSILIDAEAVYHERETALFAIMPWLFLLLPFSFVWLFIDVKRAMIPTAMVVGSLALYIAYNDFWPFNVLRFNLLHYLVWMVPVIFGCGLAGLYLAFKQRRYLLTGCALIVGLLMASVRFQMIALESTVDLAVSGEGNSRTYHLQLSEPSEIDAVDFIGARADDAIGITLIKVKLLADNEVLELFKGYRLIQINGGLRLVLNADVVAKTIRITFEQGVHSLPDVPELVQPVQFNATLSFFDNNGPTVLDTQTAIRLHDVNSNELLLLDAPQYHYWKNYLASHFRCSEVSNDKFLCRSAHAANHAALDKRFSFSLDGNGLIGLVEGWSSPEPWGVWSVSERASFIIPVNYADKQPESLKLTFNTFNGSTESPISQQISIQVNNVSAATIVTDPTTPMPIELSIDLAQNGIEAGEFLRIEFAMDTATSPLSIGMSQDNRRLAVGLISAELE
ncbi:MAG: hypothetical protein IPM37_18650 [Hahellaceae bacterium]|nr:hypothetical protein [Hahellaceae bacterium]